MRSGALLAVALAAGCAGEEGAPSPQPAPAVSRPTPPTPLTPSRVHAAQQPPQAPRWRAARVIADAPLLPAREVTAAPGDTLESIARAVGVAPGALAVANGATQPVALVPGTKLTIPAGQWHSVKPGETMSAIAHAYRAAFPAVARANGARAPYPLEVGDRVLIPSAPARTAAAKPIVPPPATVEARAQAFNLDIERLLGKEPAAHAKPPPPRAARAVPLPRTAGEDKAYPPPLGEVAATPTEGAGVRALPQAEAPAIHLDWPLTGRVLSTFGAKPGGRFNDGINIAAIAGAPVRAAADGVVAYAGTGVAAFGGLVLVRHADGWLTAYAHCEALLVAKGDSVRRGQPIARAGATGEVDAPQLHFEVRRGRVPVDPMLVLRERGGG